MKDKKTILSRIKNLFQSTGEKETEHITKRPVNVTHSYYKKSKKGNYRFYIWVLVCKEGIIHTRMPSKFTPPKDAMVTKKYLKGHRPRAL